MEDCPSVNCLLVYFLLVLESNKKGADDHCPAVQGYLKVLVLSASPGQEDGGRGKTEEREIGENRGGRERDKGDVGRQVVSEVKVCG